MAPPAGLDPLLEREPDRDPAPQARGCAEALAAVLAPLRRGARLGRALAAYDLARAGQTARGGAGDHRQRQHDRGTWRRLSPWAGRLACHHRWLGEADL